MKARIIDTNEEITLLGISVEYGTAKYLDSNGAFNVRCFRDKEIQILEAEAPINWEQRRYEIAKEALSGILADGEQCSYASTMADFAPGERRTVPKAVSQFAVACADALIEELKRTEQ